MNRMMYKTMCAALILVWVLTACGPVQAILLQPTSTLGQATPTPFQPAAASQTPEPTATTGPTETPIPAPTQPAPVLGPGNFPANIDPLTGLPVADPSILDRRPVLIKVANYPRSGRPHSGLSFADIVFEYFIGEGTNRFAGLFYGQDATKVGPIRSGRLVDIQLVSLYQGILGFVSADATVRYKIYANLGDRAITESPSTCPAICRINPTVIGVFANSAELTKLASRYGVVNQKYNLDGLVFSSQTPQGGQVANSLTMQYNSVYNRGDWRYDAATQTYLRWIEDVDANNQATMIPLVDALTTKQLAFSNVIVLYAQYDEYSATLHDVELWKNTKGGKALFFRDGMVFSGTWKPAGQDKPLQYFGPDGQLFTLRPGNSWVILTGNASRLSQPNPDQWQIDFSLP